MVTEGGTLVLTNRTLPAIQPASPTTKVNDAPRGTQTEPKPKTRPTTKVPEGRRRGDELHQHARGGEVSDASRGGQADRTKAKPNTSPTIKMNDAPKPSPNQRRAQPPR